ncbi:MAG: polysaccharide biosynthesis/export family protein [Acidobacteriota bacterium]|jgi:polysaccharide export outer membrane protein
MRSAAALLLGLAALLAVPPLHAAETPSAVTTTASIPALGGGEPEDLTLGAEDLLQIHVFEFPELDLKVRVSERGTITLPLLGEIPAQGLTVGELKARIESLLEERYLKNPQVSIFIDQHGSRKVAVLGEVAKPGMYQLLGTRTLLQVLSEAGGLTDDVGEEIYLLRDRGTGGPTRTTIRIEDLLSSADPALNLTVLPGDTITVPEDEWIHIFVDGAVRTPGRLEQRSSEPLTLLQALSRAGGPTDRANVRSVKVLRHGDDGELEESVTVNLKKVRKGKEKNPMLQDGDVVVVPEALF